MTFSFYGYLDQQFIDNLTDTHNLDSSDVKDELESIGYTAEQILDSPNPIIYAMFYLLVNKLMNELRELVTLDDELEEEIRIDLIESIYTNAMCSSLQAIYIFEKYQDNLEEVLKVQNESTDDKIKSLLKIIEELFEKYNY